MIQDEGIVSTGAGTHSPQPLQVTAKSQNRAGDSPNMEPSIGEEKAKSPLAPKCFRDSVGAASTRFATSLSRTWKIGDFSDAPHST